MGYRAPHGELILAWRHFGRSTCLAAFLAGLLLASCEPALGAEPASRTALIVAVGSYQSPDVPKLDGVPHDIASARTMARAMGIPDQNIRVLRDQEASKQKILQALAELGESTPAGGRSLIYFSGHGTRWTDPQSKTCVEGFLTYDNQTIVNRELAEATKTLADKADKVISIVDACHSGGYAGKPTYARSMGGTVLTPKFHYRARSADDACSKPVNMQTRSLLGEVIRIGGLQENFVQISSARPDEVAFDDAQNGGIATQGLRRCLLGTAKDLDRSGAVSLEEIRRCTQDFIDERLKPYKDIRPHHVTVSGARNLIPVAVKPPEPPGPAQPTPQPEASTQPVAVAPPPVVSETPTTVATPPPTAQPPASTPVVPPAPVPPPAPPAAPPEPVLASLATLRDIEQQRNPRRVVQARLAKPNLKVGKDTLDLSVTSSHDGYVYLVLLGSDAKSFYFLFPNGLDKDNRIRARQTLRLPREAWQIKAAGPAGTNHLMVMVTDSPRSLDQLPLAPPTANEPFTYALNDLPGRTAVIDYLIGRGAGGASESFGAQILRIKEVP
jgi:hypothetical protein